MKFRGEIWRQRLWIWVPALVFFLANVGMFAVYTVGYAGRLDALQEELDGQKSTLDELARTQREAQTLLARVRTNEQQVEQLYAERLSTRSRRLTGVTAEVKTMAQKTGLVPRTFSYPEEEIEKFGLIRRSFVFTAQGTYGELRKFINLVEVSRSFLTIDEVTVTGNESGPELNIALRLSTLFARDADSAAPAPASTAAPGGAP